MPVPLLDEAIICKAYPQEDQKKRRMVLRDTVEKMSDPAQLLQYHRLAEQNHARWKKDASLDTNSPKVSVIEGDWGTVTQQLSQKSGEVYAVLNMANAYVPGGGYLEGMVAQEENMFRRTDCHFHVHDEDLIEYHHPLLKKYKYKQAMIDLINGEHGEVYLDTAHPRVCIKGEEKAGYKELDSTAYFNFYELRSAADDLRGNVSPKPQNMLRKINAQLDTLEKKGVRRVVLSAFGCGAFLNDPLAVSKLYKQAIEARPGMFDDIVFAIYNAGYDKNNNFKVFHDTLNGLSLNHVVAQNALPDAKPAATDNSKQHALINAIKDHVNSPMWDTKGYVLPFFNFRKTPAGILELREVLKHKTLSPANQLQQLKDIAVYRLQHEPRFTQRNAAVQELYQKISAISLNPVADEEITAFKPKFGG